jgi:hypothetical protein
MPDSNDPEITRIITKGIDGGADALLLLAAAFPVVDPNRVATVTMRDGRRVQFGIANPHLIHRIVEWVEAAEYSFGHSTGGPIDLDEYVDRWHAVVDGTEVEGMQRSVPD